MNNTRRSQKLLPQIIKHKQVLMEQLREEWERIEKESRRQETVRRIKEVSKQTGMVLGKTILVLAGIAGVLTVVAVAPNMFGAVGRSTKRRYFFNKSSFNKTKHYLKRRGLVEIDKEKDSGFTEIKLTSKGLIELYKLSFDNLKIIKPQKWDGFWRIVIFDIPNRHKWARDDFRQKLREIGFYLLQESVFIIPYPCEKEIKFLISVFNLNNYARLIIAKEISNDADIKEYFKIQ